MRSFVVALILWTALQMPALAGENLKLNPKLDYTSDSQDGPLITGDHMDEGPVAGKPTYVIIYSEGCFNSKRQARRTVSLYEKYSGRVQFVVIDLDRSTFNSAATCWRKSISAATFRMLWCSTGRVPRSTTPPERLTRP